MSVEEILREVPKLSPEELRQIAAALCQAMEDRQDMQDLLVALQELESEGNLIPMSEIRQKYHL